LDGLNLFLRRDLVDRLDLFQGVKSNARLEVRAVDSSLIAHWVHVASLSGSVMSSPADWLRFRGPLAMQPGASIGASNDFGHFVTQIRVDMHDPYATMLHQLGTNHKAFIYYKQGRDFRLTEVVGWVLNELLEWATPTLCGASGAAPSSVVRTHVTIHRERHRPSGPCRIRQP